MQLPSSFQDIVNKNIALVRQIALSILSMPAESREAEYQSARQKFRDAGKSYGIDESIMDRFVEGNISALRCAVEEIEQRGQIGDEPV